MISYEGQLYQGTHPPMVSLESFEAIQEMFVGRRAVPSHKHHLPYRGLLRCRECMAVVTIERHWRPRYERTYLYYRCCRKNAAFGYCSEPPVNQTELETQFEEYLSTLMLPVEVEAAAFDAAVTSLRDQIGHASSSRRAIAQRNARLDMQLANLRQQVLDGTFDSTDYRAERSRIALEKERLAQEDGKLAECSRTVIEHNRPLLSLGKLALEKFRSGTSEQKHTIMQMVSLNITLGAKKVVVLAKEPFASLSQLAKMSVQVGLMGQRHELETLALSILRTPASVSKALISTLETPPHRDHGHVTTGQTEARPSRG